MDDSPIDRCRDWLHVDSSGVVHRVYREPRWLQRPAWLPDEPGDRGETLCGMRVRREAPAAHDSGPSCMACVVAMDADVFEIELRRVRDVYEGAFAMVAGMHAAATGRVGGTIRGVVEDVEDVRRERDELRSRCEAAEARCEALRAELEELRMFLLSA
jgi:hypothetical protein